MNIIKNLKKILFLSNANHVLETGGVDGYFDDPRESHLLDSCPCVAPSLNSGPCPSLMIQMWQKSHYVYFRSEPEDPTVAISVLWESSASISDLQVP